MTPISRFTYRNWLIALHDLLATAAAVVMSAAALWWCVELLLRQTGGGSLAEAVPATFVHAVLMTYGFMPLFFSGFLFTAGPRWLQMPEGEARTIRPGVVALLMGWFAWLIGARWHAGLAALGAVLAAIGWGWLALNFTRLVRHSPARDKVHGRVVMVASWCGVAGLVLTAVGVASGHFDGLRWATWLGLWWFVVPVYLAVAHRMIPFFTAAVVPSLDAWRPNWLLWALLAAAGLDVQALDHPLGTKLISHGVGPSHPWLEKEYKEHTGREVKKDFPHWEPAHRTLMLNGIPGIENIGGDIELTVAFEAQRGLEWLERSLALVTLLSDSRDTAGHGRA